MTLATGYPAIQEAIPEPVALGETVDMPIDDVDGLRGESKAFTSLEVWGAATVV
jgi:hypothetical protein